MRHFLSNDFLRLVCLLAGLSSPFAAAADSATDAPDSPWSLHAQSTFVWQRKNAFDVPYSGPQSLSPSKETSHSFSLTGYFGLRLWRGGEFYLDPESVAGVPMSNLNGLGDVANGEVQKNGGPHPHEYIGRAFLRQSIGLGGESSHVDDDVHQLAGQRDSRRIVITLGKISQTDIFEKSIDASDPRTQFLNSALTTYGAWDYAADARSYTIGIAPELYWDDWALRLGRFMEPELANGSSLDFDIERFHGDQLEIEHDHTIGSLPGSIRLLAFHNRANAGAYRDAIDVAQVNGGTPSLAAVRKPSGKTGCGISVEQALASDVGAFVRASTADDKVEEYAFIEIDNSVSGGISMQGTRWGRPHDALGLAWVSSGLNRDHRDYLAAGGLGGFIGDGQLGHYARETVVEAYYDLQVAKGVQFSLDAQQIGNPGYNADRHGPVRIFGGRLHLEI